MTDGADGRPELQIFDQARTAENDLQGLNDAALAREVYLADQAAILARGTWQDAQARMVPGQTVDKDVSAEITARTAVYAAELRLELARGEQRRRREALERERARQAAADRAQRLDGLRAAAWAQYQADMGTRLDGVSLADESVFNDRWAAFLVDLAIGRAELPRGA